MHTGRVGERMKVKETIWIIRYKDGKKRSVFGTREQAEEKAKERKMPYVLI